MDRTTSSGNINVKVGMKYHYKGDHPFVNYVVSKIWKNKYKILEMDSIYNHSIELTVNDININDPIMGDTIRKHLKDYSPTEKHDSIKDFMDYSYWTLVISE